MKVKKFRYVCKNLHFNDITMYYFTLEDIENRGRKTPSWIWSDNCEILSKDEFTGLHDKNGKKEIFESDLLKDEYGNIYEVYWCKECARWKLKSKAASQRDAFYILNLDDHSCLIFEVIGNVHESPNLLQK